MKYVYPAIFRSEPDGGFSIFFPDIQRGATQGDDIIDGMYMAKDFLCLALCDIEEDGEVIPPPSDIRMLNTQPEEFATLILVDTNEYRRYHENKMVKKTVTIPAWLNARAEEAGLDFSQILQEALRKELQIAE